MERKSVVPEQYTDQLVTLAGFIGHACAFTGHRPQSCRGVAMKPTPAVSRSRQCLPLRLTC